MSDISGANAFPTNGDAKNGEVLGNCKNTSASPALVSILLRSELLGHDKALKRLFPWSLEERGIHTTLSRETKAFLSL